MSDAEFQDTNPPCEHADKIMEHVLHEVKDQDIEYQATYLYRLWINCAAYLYIAGFEDSDFIESLKFIYEDVNSRQITDE